MIKTTLIFLILVLSFPIGYLLAYLCKDELLQGRKYFIIIGFIFAILSIVGLFFNLIISLTCLFIFIVSFISLLKSYDKKFVKKE